MNHDDQINNECHDMHVTLVQGQPRYICVVEKVHYIHYIDILHSEFICHDISAG